MNVAWGCGPPPTPPPPRSPGAGWSQLSHLTSLRLSLFLCKWGCPSTWVTSYKGLTLGQASRLLHASVSPHLWNVGEGWSQRRKIGVLQGPSRPAVSFRQRLVFHKLHSRVYPRVAPPSLPVSLPGTFHSPWSHLGWHAGTSLSQSCHEAPHWVSLAVGSWDRPGKDTWAGEGTQHSQPATQVRMLTHGPCFPIQTLLLSPGPLP